MSYRIFIIVIFISCRINSQDSSALYPSNEQLTTFETLIDSAKYHFTKDLKLAERYALEAVNFAKRNNLDYLQAKGAKSLAAILGRKGGEKNLKKAINYTLESLNYFKHQGDSLQVFTCYVNLTTMHSLLEEYPESLDFSKKMYQTATYLKSQNYPDNYSGDESIMGQTYFNLGISYDQLSIVDSALAYYKKSIPYFKEVGSYKEHAATSSVARLYEKSGDAEAAYIHYKKAYDAYNARNNTMGVISTSIAIGSLLAVEEYLNKAKIYLKDAVTLSTDKNYVEKRLISLINLSEVFFLQKQLDSADMTLSSALKLSDSLQDVVYKTNAYKVKSLIEEARGNAKGALLYRKNADSLKKIIDKRQNLGKSTSILLTDQIEKQNEIKNSFYARAKKLDLWFIGSLIFVLLILIVSLVFYRNYRKNIAERSDLLKKLRANEREKEYLSRKAISNAVNIATHQELLQNVNKLLEKTKNLSKVPFLIQEIENTQSDIKSQIEVDKAWNDFFKHFEEVHSNFIKHITLNHNLSSQEIKLCAFIKMNLGNKEICQLLNINVSSIHVVIHRLKKKLKLDQNTSVHTYLQKIPS